MKVLRHGFVLVTLATMAGCSAEGQTTPSEPTASVGTTAQDVTLQDCQKQAASCARAAKSFTDLGSCTVKFQSCTTQAALDAVNLGNTLASCRSKQTACINAAVTVQDVRACRDAYTTCASEVTTTVDDALQAAIKAAQQAIEKTGGIALDVIDNALGSTGAALDALTTCEQSANTCLKGALTPGGVAECQEVFEDCASKAVKIVDKILEPLPGPTPSQVVDGFKDCQTQATTCLAGALTSAGIEACQKTLGTCVGDATKLIDQTASELPVPLPTKALDCSTQATQCVLALKSPLECATEATKCLTTP